MPDNCWRVDNPSVLIGEASDFDWPPGCWPSYLEVVVAGVSRIYGPAELLQYHGEFGGYKYHRGGDRRYEVHVLND